MMGTLAGCRIYPIKSLDGVEVERAGLTAAGTLGGDREYAIYADGEPLNGKRTTAVHHIEASYPDPPHVVVLETAEDRQQFDLRTQREAFEQWCESYFGRALSIKRSDTGFLDRPTAGPSVVSAATLETVASWFDGLSIQELRRRLRANVEVEGVPAFWEDKFVGDGPDAFTIDDIRFEGVEPCVRCVVPERDPDTGDRDQEFRSRFCERRRETLPPWLTEEHLESLYSLTLIARIDTDGSSPKGPLTVGDPVEEITE